jgi:hypothetical protein
MGDPSPLGQKELMRMGFKKLASLLILCCVAAVGATVLAQAGGPREVVSEVGFEFSVGDKTFPAGTYHFVQPTSKSLVLVMRHADGGHSAKVEILARISRADNRPSGGHVVFNVSGDEGGRYLSEVWLPGQDGFLVQGTPEEHDHLTVPSR